MVVSFFILGFGMAINLALSNVFCVKFAKGAVILDLCTATIVLGVYCRTTNHHCIGQQRYPMVTLLPDSIVFSFGWYWFYWVGSLGLRKGYAGPVIDSVGTDCLAPGS